MGGDAIDERQVLPVRRVEDGLGARDVLSEQRAVKVDDVDFGAPQKRDAVPFTRPDPLVDEELEILDRRLIEEHGAEMVRTSQDLEAGRACGGHVLGDRGIRVAREQRVGMKIACDTVRHGHP